jgi:hypothetical protein
MHLTEYSKTPVLQFSPAGMAVAPYLTHRHPSTTGWVLFGLGALCIFARDFLSRSIFFIAPRGQAREPTLLIF